MLLIIFVVFVVTDGLFMDFVIFEDYIVHASCMDF